jgi:hypothetical protein
MGSILSPGTGYRKQGSGMWQGDEARLTRFLT